MLIKIHIIKAIVFPVVMYGCESWTIKKALVVARSVSHADSETPKDCSMPSFLDLHYLLEFVQAHIHWISDAIQPFHPLSSPSPPAFNLSQHQGLFPVSWLFASGGQIIGASASASVLPMNIQGWFPLGLTGLISLLSKGLSKNLFQNHSSKASILWHSAFFTVQLSHPYMTTGKTID